MQYLQQIEVLEEEQYKPNDAKVLYGIPKPSPTISRPNRRTSLLGATPRIIPPAKKMKLASSMQILRPKIPLR